MRLPAIITLSIFILLTISRCTFRAYPTQIFPAEMDRAIGWKGKIRIKTFEGKTFRFDAIVKDSVGNYFGQNVRTYNTKGTALNLESIKEIKLEDKSKTIGKSILINIGLSVVIVPISIITFFVLCDCFPAG